mmetsp:Transcript_73466/g.157435  ORF Transcript_73466/g.157435 Transcript_73466/m.157435 type:complete len:116 (+) Transcript_73466:81-428(+)
MVLTTLGRNAARCSALGRAVARAGSAGPKAVVSPLQLVAPGSMRRFADYDWNMGVPGSRIKNPDPQNYNDVYPSQGAAWWGLILLSSATWFWGNTYDTSRGVNIAIGLFGPNMPL